METHIVRNFKCSSLLSLEGTGQALKAPMPPQQLFSSNLNDPNTDQQYLTIDSIYLYFFSCLTCFLIILNTF